MPCLLLLFIHIWRENCWILRYYHSVQWNQPCPECLSQVHCVHFLCNPVGWGCRMHRLFLYSGVRLPNVYPGYDTKRSDGVVPLILELWVQFIAIPHRSTLTRSGSPWNGLIYGLNKTKRCTYVNCIVWNKTVLTFNCE